MSQRMKLGNPHEDVESVPPTGLPDHPAEARMGGTPRRVGPPEVIPDVDVPLHVVPDGDLWSLKFEGHPTAVAVYPTKRVAMQEARKLAKAQDCALVEHGQDGRIR